MKTNKNKIKIGKEKRNRTIRVRNREFKIENFNYLSNRGKKKKIERYKYNSGTNNDVFIESYYMYKERRGEINSSRKKDNKKNIRTTKTR